MYPDLEDEVKTLEAQVATTLPTRGTVVFYGSSSIRLWNTLPDDFPDVPILNVGFGGSTVASCAYYFNRLVAPAQPKAIVFYAGENDLGSGAKPNTVVAAFDDLHSQVAALPNNPTFVFISIKPSPARAPVLSRIQEVNRRIEDACAARPESHYVDVYTPMLDPDSNPQQKYWTDDGIHLSPEGYQLWWQILSARRRDLGF